MCATRTLRAMTPPLLRSKLFVPGARPELFAKALTSHADAVSLDLEDAVAEPAKAMARQHVAAFVQSAQAQHSRPLIIVRINALDTPHFADDVLATAINGVGMIHLPKCESRADALSAIAALQQAEARNGVAEPIGLLVNIETPRALRHAAAIAQAHPRVVGLQLGLGDLFEPLGIARHDPANVHAALFALRLAAAEAGVFCCDAAFTNVDDADGFRAEAQMSQRLGYIGKTCIHPRQVALANSVYVVANEAIAQAQRVVAAAKIAAAQGRAAFVVDGRMIDPPFLRRAEAILAAAQESSPR